MSRSSPSPQRAPLTATHLPSLKCAENTSGIAVHCGGNLQKLNDVEPTLTALIFGHKRLRSAETIGHLLLGEASLLARRNKEFAQLRLFRRMDGLAHAGRHEQRKLIPEPDYPK